MTATLNTIDDSRARNERAVQSRVSPPEPRTDPQRSSRSRTATGLGWLSIGKGLAQLAAPQTVAHLFGIRDTRGIRTTIRLLGARELVAGLGLLSGRRQSLWIRSRVAGDVLDMALVGLSLASPAATRRRVWLPTGLLTIAGFATIDIVRARMEAEPQSETGRHLDRSAAFTTISSAITIDRPPTEVYAFWRDFQNLARFMSNVESVRALDHIHSRWVVSVLGKSVHWDATVTEDRTGELIAWRTVQDADIAHEGEVRFNAAPGGRGTDVLVKLRVRPPAIPLGSQMTRLVAAIPRTEINSDLRRLKQVMELGAVVRSDASIHVGPHPARPAGKGSAIKNS